MANKSAEKLYNALRAQGKYSKSFAEFQGILNDKQRSQKLYSALSSEGLYTKSFSDFDRQFGGTTSQTTQRTSTTAPRTTTSPQKSDFVTDTINMLKPSYAQYTRPQQTAPQKETDWKNKYDVYKSMPASVKQYAPTPTPLRQDTDVSMHSAASSTWDAADREAQAEYAKLRPKKEESFWDRAVRLMTDTQMGMGNENMEKATDMIASHYKTHDLQKLSDQAWNALGTTQQKAIADEAYAELKAQYPQATEKELREAAAKVARAKSDEIMYNVAVQKNMPDNAISFFARKMAEGNSIASLFTGLARQKAGTVGDLAAETEANERYGKKHKVAGIAGSVVGMASDPLTYAAGGVGGAATKGALWAGGKVLTEAAARKLSTTLGGRLVLGSVGGAANFATFEAGGEAVNQYKWGGALSVDPNTGRYVVGDYSFGNVAGKAGHGFAMGGITGVFGTWLGNVSTNLTKATTSTLGKVGVRAGELGVGMVGEGTIFATPEFISTYGEYSDAIKSLSDPKSANYIADENERKKRIAELESERGERMMDIWEDNVAMMAGFKSQHVLKSVRGTISELAASRQGRVGFTERMRNILDGHPSLALTNEEQAELNKYGYGDLTGMLKEYKEYEAKGGRNLPYNRFAELVSDKNVSEAARAKMYYYLTGHTLPMHAVLSSNLIDNGDKTYTVQSLGENGVITSRTYKDRKRADYEKSRIDRQAELNGVAMAEQTVSNLDRSFAVKKACETIAQEKGFTADYLMRLLNKEPDKLSTTEKRIVSEITKKIQEVYSSTGTVNGEHVDIVNAKETIKAKYGIDVDKAYQKSAENRTQKEKEAIEAYNNSLFETTERRSSGLNADGHSDAYRRGHDADGQTMRETYLANKFEPSQETEEAFQGVKDRVTEDAQNQAALEREELKQMTHTDGSTHLVTLKEKDANGNGKQVYVVEGNVVMKEDGSGVDVERSDKSVVVYNPSTGEKKMLSPSAVDGIESLGEVKTAEQNEAVINARMQSVIQEDMDAITCKAKFVEGMPLNMTNGKVAKVESISEDGETADCVFEDGSHITLQRSDLQRVQDEAWRTIYMQKKEAEKQKKEEEARLASEEESRTEEKSSSESETTQEYAQGDELDVVVDGKKMHAEIVSPKDDDGRFVVNVDDGETMRSLYVTPEELASMEYKEPKEEPLPESETPRPIETEEPPIGDAAPTEHTPTALERVPKDEKGNAKFHEVDAETGWDALVEMSQGDAETAQTAADMSLENADKKLKTAQKAKPKGNTPEEILKSVNDNKAAVAEAQREVDAWKAIAGERKRREDAERQRVEAERKAKEEAERIAKEKAEEEARVDAEKKAEAERKAKEEAERLEAERKAKEEKERKEREEAERQRAEAERAEKERAAKEESERIAKEKAEAEEKARIEAERKAKEEAERKAKEEAERAEKEKSEARKSILDEAAEYYGPNEAREYDDSDGAVESAVNFLIRKHNTKVIDALEKNDYKSALEEFDEIDKLLERANKAGVKMELTPKEVEFRDKVRNEAEKERKEKDAELKEDKKKPQIKDVVKVIYEKGKSAASKLFGRSFFDVAKTPDFMKKLGLTGDRFTIKYGVLSRHAGKDDSHSLTEKQWEELPDALQKPFAITRFGGKENGYRLYTTMKNDKGETIVVGVDVKNAGRDMEVNAISTIFGRRSDATKIQKEEVLYTDENITPEQRSLLGQPNSDQYTDVREGKSSTDKGSEKSEKKQEAKTKKTKKTEKKTKKKSVFDKAKEIADKEEKKRKEEAEDNSALGQATRAVGKKKKVDPFKYAASKKHLSSFSLEGVYYKDGYAYASDTHVLLKMKADYPKEWEGTIRDKDGNVIEGKYPDAEKAIKRAVYIPDKEVESLPTKDVLDFAIAANKKLKGTDVPVAVDGTFFDPVLLKKFLEAVTVKGMDKIVYRHPALYATNGKDEIVLMHYNIHNIDVPSMTEWASMMEGAGLSKELIDAWAEHIKKALKKPQYEDFAKAEEKAKKKGVRPKDVEAEAEEKQESKHEAAGQTSERRTISEENRKAAEELAGALGYKVEWVDGMKDNGTIDHETKTIRIAMDAERPLEAVFGHEVTHGVRQLAGDRYDALEAAAKKMVGEADWKRRMNFKRRHTDYSEEKLAEEVVADIVGEAVEDRNAMRRLAKDLKGERGIIDRIRDTIRKIGEWFKHTGDKEGYRRMQDADRLLSEFADAMKDGEVNADGKISDNITDRSARESDEDRKTEKERQLDIIKETNPMLDDYHTGIRSVDDIKTFGEALDEARKEAEKYGDETWSAYPDITNDLLSEAERSGEITIYSSNPIKNGAFVTPSLMQATDYAGGEESRVHSKTVALDKVAWISTDEGQYADTSIDRSARESRGVETELTEEDRKIRDSLVERMRKAGLDVVTDSEEMQRAIDDENERTRKMFVGERGATAADIAEERTVRIDNLSVARQMEEAKKDAKAIKLATGWERGADGKWRYEVGDIKPKPFAEWMDKRNLKLGDIVDSDSGLFEMYPELKDYKVTRGKGASTLAAFHPSSGKVEINFSKFKSYMSIPSNREKVDRILQRSINHEIQHAIQHIEGFAKGTAANAFRPDAPIGQLREMQEADDRMVHRYNAMSYVERALGEGVRLKERILENRKEYNALASKYRFGKDGYTRAAGEVEARNTEKRIGMTEEERRASLASETEDVAREDQILLGVGDTDGSNREMSVKETGEREEVNAGSVREHRVYHGSGADFDQFDHSHMGEGEGNQAYGWGSYVTSVEGIGRHYAITTSKPQFGISDRVGLVKEIVSEKGKNITEAEADDAIDEIMSHLNDAIEELGGNESDIGAIVRKAFNLIVSDSIRPTTREQIVLYSVANRIEGHIDAQKPRFIYSVDIPDNNGSNYLAWDEKLPKRMGKDKILSIALESISDARGEELSNAVRKAKTGEELYRALQKHLGNKGASEVLAKAGFVGIEYAADSYNGHNDSNAKNYVIFNEGDLKITDKQRFLRTEEGEVYGLVKDGRIYLDPKVATSETAVHEYTHLWGDMLRRKDPEQWSHTVKELKNSVLWEEVKELYPELKTDDEIADEVLSTFSGRRGAERLREEARKIQESDGSVFTKAKALAALENVKNAIREVWRNVLRMVGINRYARIDEVADMALKDLLSEKNPLRNETDMERRGVVGETLATSGTYFSGGGLLEAGLKGVIDPKVAVEYSGKIAGVYADNHGNHIVVADVRDVDPKKLVGAVEGGEVQYFHASPVCKNFSRAKRDGGEVELDKETATATADFIAKTRPKVVTIENVKGYRGSDALKIITDELTRQGYDWDADVYNTADYGGYTKRERLIVRAKRDGKLPPKPTPLPKEMRKAGWYGAVEDLIPHLEEKKTGVPPSTDERLKNSGIDYRKIDKPLYVMGHGYANRTMGYAFADELLPTLTTGGGDIIIMPGGKVLKASPRVLARVTGLPDDYVMPKTDQLAHMVVGNGIPAQLTKGVIAPLLDNAIPSAERATRREGVFEAADRIAQNLEGRMRAMGTRVEKRMAEVAQQLEGRELTAEQRAVADVFGGKSDNQKFSVEREDGTKQTYLLKQGNEEKAGAKHSLYRHYGTSTGVITADDVLKIPQVLERGERTEKAKGGKKMAVYTMDVDGTKFTVYTRIGKDYETIDDFYSNKKGSERYELRNTDGVNNTPEGALNPDSEPGTKVANISEPSKPRLSRRPGESIFDVADRASKDVDRSAREGKTEYDYDGEDDSQRLYNAAVDGRKSRAIESWQDEMFPVKMLQEAIEKATGEKIADFENAYLLENQLGSAGNATLEKYAREVQNPMRKVYLEMLKAKFEDGSEVTKADINKYVIAVHGLERNKYMAEKNKGLPDARRDYSGFTALFGNREQVDVEELERRAEEYIGKFEGAVGKGNADKLWSLVDESRKRTLDVLVRSGLISSEAANEWLRRFDHYVPLQGFAEEVIGEDRNANFENHITGRMSEARDPLATLVNMEYVAVTSGNHNRVKQALYNLALNHKTNLLTIMPMFSVKNPTTGEWEDAVPPIDENMSPDQRQKAMNGFVKDMRARIRDEKDLPEDEKTVMEPKKVEVGRKVMPKAMPDFLVRMKINGRQYAVVVNGNPRAAQAVNGRLRVQPNKAEQIFGTWTRWMSAAVTSWNPSFMISNFARDVQAANAFAYSNEGAKYAAMMDAEIHKNLSLASLGRDLSGMKDQGIYKLYYKYNHNQLDMNNDRERFFKEFIDNGGETGYTQMVDIDKIARRMQREEFSAIKTVKAVGSLIETANKGFENATRFGAYVTSRKMGKSVMQSINDAKEISVNFNRHGNGRNGYAMAKSLFQFLNPSIQGLEKQLRTIKEHPFEGVASMIATPITLGLAIPLINIGLMMLSGDGGGDDNKYYWSLSDWTRRNNIIIGVNGKFMKIPLPPELRLFYGIGEMAASKLANPYDRTNLLVDIPIHIMEALPFNDTNSTFPTFVKPFIESEIVDKDFMGRKITGRSDYNTLDPEWKRAGNNTDEEYIAFSKWWHGLFTKNDNEKGGWFANINPSVLEHHIMGYTGGVGKTIGQLYTTVKGLINGTEEDYSDASNWPIVNRVYTQTNGEEAEKRYVNSVYRFYENNYKYYQNTFSETKKDEGKGVFQESARISDMYNSAEFKRYVMTKPFMKADKLLLDEIKVLKEADDKESLKWLEQEQTRIRSVLVKASVDFDAKDNAGDTKELDRLSRAGAFDKEICLNASTAPNKDMQVFAKEYNKKVKKYPKETNKEEKEIRRHIHNVNK